MTDITACSGKGCPLKDKCYRYTCKKNPYWQSYFMEPPFKDGNCEYYWKTKEMKQKDMDTEFLLADIFDTLMERYSDIGTNIKEAFPYSYAHDTNTIYLKSKKDGMPDYVLTLEKV